MLSTLNFLHALTLPLLALPQLILQPLRLEIRPQMDKNQIEPVRRFRQRWFPVTADGIRAASTYALNAGQSMGVYASLNARTGNSGASDDVPYVSCLWASIDNMSGEAIKLICDAREDNHFALPAPTIALHSGGGVHCAWLLPDPLDTATNRDRIQSAVRRLSRHLNDVAQQTGNNAIAESNTAYLSYMVRVPGTHNHKNGVRRPVRLLRCAPESARHNLTWWRAHLPADPAPRPVYRDLPPIESPRPLPADVISLLIQGAPPETRHTTALKLAGKCIALGHSPVAVESYLEKFAEASGWRVQAREIPNIIRHCTR